MLIEVINFLPDQLLEELVQHSQQSDTSWEPQQEQEKYPRLRLVDESTPTMVKACKYFSSLPMFSKLDLLSVTMWKDEPNFWMDPHVDNEDITVAIQIYLDDRNSPGTTFGDRTIHYGRNRGYIMFNDATKEHSVPKQIPHEGRLSIYAIYH